MKYEEVLRQGLRSARQVRRKTAESAGLGGRAREQLQEIREAKRSVAALKAEYQDLGKKEVAQQGK